MNRFDRYSIKWRLFGYLVFFVAIPIALIWFFQIAFLEQFYTTIKVRDVRTAAETVVANISTSNPASLVEEIARQNDVAIGIYASDGSPLYYTSFGPQSGVLLDDENVARFFSDTQENGGQSFQMFNRPEDTIELGAISNGVHSTHKKQKDKSIVYALTMQYEGEDVLLLINTVVSPVNATVRTLRMQAIYITFILLILSLLIAFMMSRHISTPIIKLNRSAKELAKGDYNTVFDAHGYLEIAELNKTLNFAASEMSKADRLRQELIANVSHDLRTPLTMIIGYAEMMRDLPNENTPENVQMIVDEAQRLTFLVNDMLDISQLQAGHTKLNLQTCNLTMHMRDVIERYAKLSEQDGYTIEFSAHEDVYVNCDNGRIIQALYNLINNAVNYTGPDKTVRVRQIVKGDTVRIEVEDSGKGIDEKDLPYIWDRYYKSNEPHKRITIGTGLGLSIVRSILESHQATYGVDSTPGAGSTFWFELKTSTPEA